jgi:hypothetical protein
MIYRLISCYAVPATPIFMTGLVHVEIELVFIVEPLGGCSAAGVVSYH